MDHDLVGNQPFTCQEILGMYIIRRHACLSNSLACMHSIGANSSGFVNSRARLIGVVAGSIFYCISNLAYWRRKAGDG